MKTQFVGLNADDPGEPEDFNSTLGDWVNVISIVFKLMKKLFLSGHKSRGQAGFNILEVSAALVIFSGLTLGISSFVANMNKNMQAMDAVGSRSQLEARIRSLLSDFETVRASAVTHAPAINARTRDCIVPNDGRTCTPNATYGFRIFNRSGVAMAGESLNNGVPYTPRGARSGPRGACGNNHSEACPIVAWVVARPYCTGSASSCDTASYIEFTYRIEQGSAAYKVRGLGDQRLQTLSGFVVLDTRRSEARDETRCPVGNAEIGRDASGRSICDPKCSEGYEGTGGRTRDPAGNIVNACRPITNYCGRDEIFVGFNPNSTPICRRGCGSNAIQTGWLRDGNARCLELTSAQAQCPPGQIQVGFNASTGNVQCKVPGSACTSVSSEGTCPAGSFAVYLNPNLCAWNCRSICTKKGGCRNSCTADCRGRQNMRCCRL